MHEDAIDVVYVAHRIYHDRKDLIKSMTAIMIFEYIRRCNECVWCNREIKNTEHMVRVGEKGYHLNCYLTYCADR